MADSRRRYSYLARALLASAVLYFASQLSAGDRGPVDFVVLGLCVLAVAWNVVQLSRRFHADGGGRAAWHVQRTTLFWILGLMNTIGARPESLGGWRTWVGGALLVIAVFDTVALARREAAILRSMKDDTVTT